MGLLDGELAQSIYDGFKDKLLTFAYRERTVPDSGALDELGDPLDLASDDTDCQGFIDEYSAFTRAQAGIPDTDLKVCLFGKSLPGVTPKREALVHVTGPTGSIYYDRWFQIRERGIDPAGALWECQSFEVAEPSP